MSTPYRSIVSMIYELIFFKDTVMKLLHILTQAIAGTVMVPLHPPRHRKRDVVILAKRCAKPMPPLAGLLAVERMLSSANENTTQRDLTSRRARAAV